MKPAFYIGLQFLIFAIVCTIYLFSEELNLDSYLSYLVFICSILYIIIFFRYRKKVLEENEKNSKQ
jgi:hypothetical protein